MRSFLFTLVILFSSTLCADSVNTTHQQPLAHPLGDQLYAEVYTFIGRFLEENTETIATDSLQNWYESEKTNAQDHTLKSHNADMHEGEIAGLLQVLWSKDKRYQNITLYRKDGLGLATSGMCDATISFKERPQALHLGFLTREILSGPGLYRYEYNKTMYEEHILPIYSDSHIYCTSSLTAKNKGGILIGYLSYIAISDSSGKASPL